MTRPAIDCWSRRTSLLEPSDDHAKRVGYPIGTIYHVIGTLDRPLVVINTRIFVAWAAHLRAALTAGGDDRIAVLVAGYFDFARRNAHSRMTIYDHRLPPAKATAEEDAAERGALTGIVVDEVARALEAAPNAAVTALPRSLVATVHGHCSFAVTGSFARIGDTGPEAAALAPWARKPRHLARRRFHML